MDEEDVHASRLFATRGPSKVLGWRLVRRGDTDELDTTAIALVSAWTPGASRRRAAARPRGDRYEPRWPDGDQRRRAGLRGRGLDAAQPAWVDRRRRGGGDRARGRCVRGRARCAGDGEGTRRGAPVARLTSGDPWPADCDRRRARGTLRRCRPWPRARCPGPRTGHRWTACPGADSAARSRRAGNRRFPRCPATRHTGAGAEPPPAPTACPRVDQGDAGRGARPARSGCHARIGARADPLARRPCEPGVGGGDGQPQLRNRSGEHHRRRGGRQRDGRLPGRRHQRRRLLLRHGWRPADAARTRCHDRRAA